MFDSYSETHTGQLGAEKRMYEAIQRSIPESFGAGLEVGFWMVAEAFNDAVMMVRGGQLPRLEDTMMVMGWPLIMVTSASVASLEAMEVRINS